MIPAWFISVTSREVDGTNMQNFLEFAHSKASYKCKIFIVMTGAVANSVVMMVVGNERESLDKSQIAWV